MREREAHERAERVKEEKRGIIQDRINNGEEINDDYYVEEWQQHKAQQAAKNPEGGDEHPEAVPGTVPRKIKYEITLYAIRALLLLCARSVCWCWWFAVLCLQLWAWYVAWCVVCGPMLPPCLRYLRRSLAALFVTECPLCCLVCTWLA